MKNFRIAAIVMAAALLVIGASMTAYAGWNNLGNGDYTYTNSDGDLVTDTWKKDGTLWFYLDSDGYMARNTMIDADGVKKYVDDNGAMVVNDWRWYQGEDDDEGFYYYFGSNGKSTTGKKKVDGKTYFFDPDFRMLTGWVVVDGDAYKSVDDDDDTPYISATYFCGEDGAMVSGTWMEVEYDDEDTATSETGWIYLQTNGKKLAADRGKTTTKKINGATYLFDENGLMLYDWKLVDGKLFYFGEKEDGAKKTGWFWAKSNVWTEDTSSQGWHYTERDDDTKYHWYYATSDGIARNQIKKINGKYYGFDQFGVMLSGYYFLGVDSDNNIATMSYNDKAANIFSTTTTPSFGKYQGEIKTDRLMKAESQGPFYFFGEEQTDGAMKTGTLDVTTAGDDGKTYSMTFQSKGDIKGMAFAGQHKNSLYTLGVKVKASEEDKILIYYTTDDDATVDPYWYKTTAKDVIDYWKEHEDADHDYKSNNKIGNKSYTGVWFTTASPKYIVITTSGTVVTSSTTKTDGDDYKVQLENGEVKAVYYEV